MWNVVWTDRLDRRCRPTAAFLCHLGLILGVTASAAIAGDVARLPNVEIEGQTRILRNDVRDGSVLVISVTIDGNFSDAGPDWVTSVEGAGYTADLYYDPQLYGWPELSGYGAVIVAYNDVWWHEGSGGFGDDDETVLSGYDGGLAIIGQDYINSTGHGDGPTPWLMERFAISDVTEDVNFGDGTEMTLIGSSGGPFVGLSGSGLPCFESNQWFTDDVTADSLPTQDWTTVGGYSGHGGAAVHDGLFSANAYECFSGFEN